MLLTKWIPATIALVVLSCASASAGTTGKAPARTYDINQAHLLNLIRSIQCLPHEPETVSVSTPKTAIKDGDVAVAAGHCQQAIADYQVAIDANQQDGNALWHQEIVDLAELGQTGDRKIASDVGEKAYHVADLAVAAEPNNALFLELRAEGRLILIPFHILGRSPFTYKHYIDSEYQHSYDDLSKAIVLAPNFGQGFASRWIIDLHRNDQEQASYDLAQAQKFDPEAAKQTQDMYEQHQARVAAIEAAQERQRMAMAEAMMGLAIAAGGYEYEP